MNRIQKLLLFIVIIIFIFIIFLYNIKQKKIFLTYGNDKFIKSRATMPTH